MAQDKQRLIEGLEKAMRAEMEGYHFYTLAAQNTKDATGQETFKYLADEEKDHFNFLKAHLESVSKNDRIADGISLGTAKDIGGDHPIFSTEIRERIGKAHYEMTALAIGIQLEKSAVDFYRAEAEASDDHAVKALYMELMQWEEKHLAAFQGEMDTLQKEYWAEARFEPF
jgi:rubrerythrin